jgi:hypothetical protein
MRAASAPVSSKEINVSIHRSIRIVAIVLFVSALADCAHAPSTAGTSITPSPGMLSIDRSGERVPTVQTRESIRYSFARDGNVWTAREVRATVGGQQINTDLRGTFAPDRGGTPVLDVLFSKDTLGNADEVHYDRQGHIKSLVENLPGVLQLNRVNSAAGGYRAVEKITGKNATIVSHVRTDAAGNGAWTIALFPRSAESGTYYGVLSDAEMERDVVVRTSHEVQEVRAGREYAVGYDTPPPMHDVFTRPATLSDPITGSVERVHYTLRPNASGGGDIVVTDTGVHSSWPSGQDPGTVTTIVIRESAVVPSPQGVVLVLEDVRRLMRIELAKLHVADTLVVIRGRR